MGYALIVDLTSPRFVFRRDTIVLSSVLGWFLEKCLTQQMQYRRDNPTAFITPACHTLCYASYYTLNSLNISRFVFIFKLASDEHHYNLSKGCHGSVCLFITGPCVVPLVRDRGRVPTDVWHWLGHGVPHPTCDHAQGLRPALTPPRLFCVRLQGGLSHDQLLVLCPRLGVNVTFMWQSCGFPVMIKGSD